MRVSNIYNSNNKTHVPIQYVYQLAIPMARDALYAGVPLLKTSVNLAGCGFSHSGKCNLASFDSACIHVCAHDATTPAQLQFNGPAPL